MNSKIKAWEIQTDGKMDNDVNMKQQGAEITAWEEGKTRDHAFLHSQLLILFIQTTEHLEPNKWKNVTLFLRIGNKKLYKLT